MAMMQVEASENAPNSAGIDYKLFKYGNPVVEEEPWMHTLCANVHDFHCYSCLKPLWKWGPVIHDKTKTPKLKNNRCSGCKFAKYCSVECQKSDWTQRHKFECDALRQIVQGRGRKRKIGDEKGKIEFMDSPESPDSLFQLMFKIVAKLAHQSTNTREFLGPKEGKRTFWDLSGAVDEIKFDHPLMQRLEKMRQTIASDLNLPERKMEQVAPLDKFVEIFARVKCNACYIMGNDGRFIGVGIYIKSSSVKHSCKPNAVRFFEGKRLSIQRTFRVESLSQLTVSLVDELEPLRYRRKNLKELYHIDCQCEACSDPEKDAEMFALKCVNPSCDAKIPSDDRADQPCPKCGQKGENRQKEFYEIHDEYLTIVDKSIDNSRPCKNDAAMVKLGVEKMKQLYHPTNPLWVDINARTAWIQENYHLDGFVKFYRTAVQLIRPWVSCIDPRRGWYALRSASRLVYDERDLVVSLGYYLEGSCILCKSLGADKDIGQKVLAALMSLHFVKKYVQDKNVPSKEDLPNWFRFMDQAFNGLPRFLQENCEDCYPAHDWVVESNEAARFCPCVVSRALC